MSSPQISEIGIDRASQRDRARRFTVAVPFIAAFIFAMHALILRTWLIDDAGISFAYARNLARGYGLTAQPGAIPIEGYSNCLWVLLITPFYLTHTFNEVLTPKILALILTTLSFVVLARTLTRNDELSPWAVLVGLCLIALQPAFVIWSMSGLENPLFVFLISSLFAMTLVDVPGLVDGNVARRGRLASAGALAAAIAFTRPDGLIYIVAYPGALLGFYLVQRWSNRRPRQSLFDFTKHLEPYAAGYSVVFSVLLASRVMHFHQLWPNTYLAKGGPTFETLINILLLRQVTIDQLLTLLESVTIWPTLWALLLPLAASSYLWRRRAFRPMHGVLLWFLAISVGSYLLLPPDWMPLFRFATPVYVFLYLYAASLVAGILLEAGGASSMSMAHNRYLAAAVLAVVVPLAFVQVQETLKFSERPTTPLGRISEIFGKRFNRCAEMIGVPNPSVLLCDLGGTLLHSKMRVYDLAGLCDRTVAITLGSDRPRFYNYVFETTKPTFIHVHGWWTWYVRLDSDPRLARDYVLIHQLNEPENDWRDYVRRDALGRRNELLPALDAEIRGSLGAIARPQLWPAAASPAAITDPATEARISALMAQMSLEEKVGQTMLAETASITPQDLRRYPLGALFAGGDSTPGSDKHPSAVDWLAFIGSFRAVNSEARPKHVPIPLLYGIDAVHGNNKIRGATVFPHNIGLGAARDPDLIRRIGEATAEEVAVIGADWTFAPMLAVPRDLHWGRSYEGYGEDPAIVASYAGPITLGLQGPLVANQPLGLGHIVGTAKHFLADGATEGGVDQGDSKLSEADLIRLHVQGYPKAIEAGILSVMVSLSSWNGVKHTGNTSLLTDVLKGRLGFAGLAVGDWNGHGQIPGCSSTDCPQALNAGLDMYMVPDGWKGLYESTVAEVKSGVIPMARLDDAVRRILRVKFKAGLFDARSPIAGQFSRLGSPEHRALAREAVRKSLVLLKNKGDLLPIKASAHVLVAGDGADNIAKQCGGWTLNWQGAGNQNSDFPNGQSIYAGIAEAVRAGSGQVEMAVDGSYKDRPDVAIVVFGENPYAEFKGDLKTLEYQAGDKRDLALLKTLKAERIPVVSVFLSGRPLRTASEISASNAFVAAWLPGTEGGGVADVLIGQPDGRARYNFEGRLPFSWPKRSYRTAGHSDEPDYDPEFAYGYGLTYAQGQSVAVLSGKEKPGHQ